MPTCMAASIDQQSPYLPVLLSHAGFMAVLTAACSALERAFCKAVGPAAAGEGLAAPSEAVVKAALELLSREQLLAEAEQVPGT